jgi:topoisomerase (DNA) II binding protein 1
LERCVESGKILVPKSEFLFTPFSLPDEVFPLQDCVLSISQYADAEREHLMHLIEVLGM